MPDAKKLPVIYLRIGEETRFGGCYVRIRDFSLQPKEGLDAYETAVPKCKTCGHFQPCGDDSDGQAAVEIGCSIGFVDDIAQDGSDYCSKHSELQR